MARKAVVLAAGNGARLAPITACVPKELLPLAGFPALHHVLAEAAEAGVTDARIVLSKGKDSIKRYFDRACPPKGDLAKTLCAERDRLLDRMRVSFVYQKKPLGTGDAILAASDFAGDDPILVLYPDDVLGISTARGFRSFGSCGDQAPTLVLFHEAERGRSAVLVREIPGREAKNYGVVYPAGSETEDRFFVRKIEEKPIGYALPRADVLLGRMVLSPSALRSLSVLPRRDDAGVVPALNLEAKNGALIAVRFQGECFDLGSHESYLSAAVKCAEFLE